MMRKAYTSYDIIASKNMSDTSHTFSSTNQKFPLQIMLKKNLCKIYRQLLVVFFFWGGGEGHFVDFRSNGISRFKGNIALPFSSTVVKGDDLSGI